MISNYRVWLTQYLYCTVTRLLVNSKQYSQTEEVTISMIADIQIVKWRIDSQCSSLYGGDAIGARTVSIVLCD